MGTVFLHGIALRLRVEEAGPAGRAFRASSRAGGRAGA